MRIGVFGTGKVGTMIATKLVELGHEVMPGSGTADNENAAAWVATTGERASHGTFADAAAHGELLFNCTGGLVSLDALRSVRPDDMSTSRTPSTRPPASPVLTGPDSLGERIQREFPTHEWSRR